MTDSFAIRNVSNANGSAFVSDYGAHVLQWAPTGQAPVLWQPKTMALKAGSAMRAGVPVVFPWFNGGYENGATAAKKPKHGLGRISFWQLDETASTDSHLRYVLDSSQLDPTVLDQIMSGPGANFRAVYDVEVGGELTMSLTVFNNADAPLTYEAALHTYLHVGDIADVTLAGLQGTRYLDTTREGFPECVQEDELLAFDGMVDYIYYAADAAVEVRDASLNRVIAVKNSGAPQTVVWNPGEQLGNALGDLEAGEWRGFVCVEAAANRDQSITVAPHESHTISQTLSLR